jgi:excisionase family DNA binding protein
MSRNARSTGLCSHPQTLVVPPVGLRSREAARALGISESTLRRLTQAGEISCIKRNRLKIYAYDELQRWVRDETQAQTKPEEK